MKSSNRRSFICTAGATSAAVFLERVGVAGKQAVADAAQSLSAGKTTYSDIPCIDVHTHVGGEAGAIARYLAMRDILLGSRGNDLAIWINLGSNSHPILDFDSVMKAGRGRILCCISDYSSHDGLDIPPDELPNWLERGYIGYKIWAGPPSRRLKPDDSGFPYIDDPAHDPTFDAMEKAGMVCASIHIADPNGPYHHRTKWLPDPVEFWREMMAFRARLARNPGLTVVAAHGMWSVCQDAQIDFLRYMLGTYPNLNIDLAATFQYYHLVSRDNLRDFMIEWSDRILFGTDAGRWSDADGDVSHAERYSRCFRMLETDELVEGGFFSMNEAKGLALPRDVLEKIYFKNAVRIYPRVGEHLRKLGYTIG